MKILIIVASQIELGNVFEKPINKDVDLLITGVGKINACKNVCMALNNRSYDVIINAGTCGSDKYAVGDIIMPGVVLQGDCFLDKGFSCSVLSTSGDPNVKILTSDKFVVKTPNSEGTLVLPENVKDVDLFDMESYAIVEAVKTFSYSHYPSNKIDLIKIVSDNLDQSVYDWEERAKILAEKLWKYVEHHIQNNYIPNFNLLEE